MEWLNKAINFVNDNILWGIPMIVAILATGVFISVRTRFLQVRKFGTAMSSTFIPMLRSVGKKKDKNKNAKTVSQFEAFSAAISGTVGTGNMVGVATALISGGPGAIFWMWVSAFFGLVTNYSENVLGLYYRKKDKKGEMCGGPMYYISNGLNLKWLALIFATCCALAAVGMGMVQTNSISGTLQKTIAGGASVTTAVVVGIVVVILTALIVVGGIKRIGKVSSYIVPFMALLFILMSIIILCINITAIPKAFALIFANAFSFRSVSGGFLGYVIMKGMRFGFARGIFSNEAGLGSSVIAHSASETKEPVKQGLWGILEVFIDTFVVCTLTALSLLTVCVKTGAYDFTDIAGNVAAGLSGSAIAPLAFTETFGTIGQVVFSIILPLFAFTTILAWAYYGEKAVQYLFGKNGDTAAWVFKILYVGLLFVGAMVKSDFVWALDDMFNAMMALPNLVALIFLSKQIIDVTKNYFARKSGSAVSPMLSAYDDLNTRLIEELKEEEETEAANAAETKADEEA